MYLGRFSTSPPISVSVTVDVDDRRGLSLQQFIGETESLLANLEGEDRTARHRAAEQPAAEASGSATIAIWRSEFWGGQTKKTRI
jgi:hypothetical protein